MTFADKMARSLQDLAFKGLTSENRDKVIADGAFQIAKEIYQGAKIKGARYEVIEDIAADIEEFFTDWRFESVGLDEYYHLYDFIVCKYI